MERRTTPAFVGAAMIAMGGVAAIMHLWRKNSSKVISDDTSPGPAEAMTHDHIMCRALREIAAEDSDQEDHLEAPLLPYPEIEGNANQELPVELAEPATADAHDEPRKEIVQDVAPEQNAVEPKVQNAPLEAPAAEQPAAAAEEEERWPEEAADDSSEESFGVIVADVDYSGYVPSLWGMGFAGGAFPYDEAMQG